MTLKIEDLHLALEIIAYIALLFDTPGIEENAVDQLDAAYVLRNSEVPNLFRYLLECRRELDASLVLLILGFITESVQNLLPQDLKHRSLALEAEMPRLEPIANVVDVAVHFAQFH